MSYENILLDVTDGVARLTLHRPEKLNSFNTAMHEEMRDALGRVSEAKGLRVLVLTGAGRAFCAGQDLGDSSVAPGAEAVDLGLAIETYYAPMVMALRNLQAPVLCAVNGVAAGAGANLALVCDIVVAKKSASFIQSFARLGLIPDTGGTYMLPRLAGMARAMGMALLGDKVSAEQAEAWGMIWKCFEDDVFESETERLVQQLAGGPTLGLTRTKQALHASAHATFAEQIDMERSSMRVLGMSEDYAEGVRAFLEKRAPVFHGR